MLGTDEHPMLLASCDQIRSGFEWYVDAHPLPCACGRCDATGRRVSTHFVTLTGTKAQICVYVGMRKKLAFLRTLEPKSAICKEEDYLVSETVDLGWVHDQVDRLLPIYDALERA